MPICPQMPCPPPASRLPASANPPSRRRGAALVARKSDCSSSGMARIQVFGASWCAMTNRTIQHLQNRGIDYEYIDVEENPRASEWVRQQNDGKERKPTINIDGTILAEPSNEELDEILAQSGV